MEVIERKENPLLDRVEIRFRWEHTNSPTPSLKEMVAAAAKAEPGAKEDLVFVKDRKSTRLNSSHALISYAVFCLKKKTRMPSSA